jgi:hypothetical protein
MELEGNKSPRVEKIVGYLKQNICCQVDDGAVPDMIDRRS